MGFRRAKSTQGNTNCQKNIFEDDQVPGHHPRALSNFTPSAHVRRQSLPVWPPTLNNYLYLTFKAYLSKILRKG